MNYDFLLYRTLLLFISCNHQWWNFFPPCNQTPDNSCLIFYRPNFEPLLLQYRISLPSHTWTLIFWFIVHFIKTILHNLFCHLCLLEIKRCIHWAELLLSDHWFYEYAFHQKIPAGLMPKKEVDFFIVGCNTPYLYLLPFVKTKNTEKVKWLFVSTIFPLFYLLCFICKSVEHNQFFLDKFLLVYTYPHSLYLVEFSVFCSFRLELFKG